MSNANDRLKELRVRLTQVLLERTAPDLFLGVYETDPERAETYRKYREACIKRTVWAADLVARELLALEEHEESTP